MDFLADVMVLNDIIEQAAGRHSRASDRGGKVICVIRNCKDWIGV